MFIAPVPVTQQQIIDDARMVDQISRMYRKLADEDRCDLIDNYKIKVMEEELHAYYAGVLRRERSYKEFIEKLKAFYDYYLKHAPKQERDEASITWLKERGYVK